MHSPIISTNEIRNSPVVIYTEFVCSGMLIFTDDGLTICSIRKLIAVFANDAVTNELDTVFILISFNNALPNSNDDFI